VTDEGKVKGSALRPLVEWFAGTCGEAAVEEVAELLSPARRAEVRLGAPALGILPAGWYSEMLASELSEAVLDRTAPLMEERQALREIGETIFDRSLGRISRAAISWFASPQMIAQSSGMWWRMYHKTGTVTARLDGDVIYATGEGWGEHTMAWCKVVGSSCRHALDLAGCIDATVTDHVCARGVGQCAMAFRWNGRR
jgi:hypothetical protein